MTMSRRSSSLTIWGSLRARGPVRHAGGALVGLHPQNLRRAFAAQGNSIAGKRKGNEDERSGLIYNVLEKINEAKPAMVFLENVPAALKSSCRVIIDNLLDYEVAWGRVSAQDVGYLQK